MAKVVGLRTEILTTITLLMGAALLLGGLLMLRLTEQSLLEQKVGQLRVMNEIIAHSLAESTERSERKREQPFSLSLMNELPEELKHDGWWLYGADLQMLASYRTGDAQPVSAARRQQVKLSLQAVDAVEFPSLLQMFGDTKASAHFVVPVQLQNRFLGLLEVNYSLGDVRYRLLLSQRMVLVYIFLYGMVLVGVGYYLLQRNVIKPARNLLQATEDVARGHLETRLPVAGPVEIARLADAYNQMVEALQSSRFETRTHIETLELTNKELQQTRDELVRSEKLASVGQLAAGLAHELGNPLAALIGYLEFLKAKLGGENQEVVQRALAEAERIDYLVRELLDFSRPADSEFELLNPLEPLQAAVQLLKHQSVFATVEIVDQLPDCLPQVKANRHKLQQLYVNLLLNAAQACVETGEIILTAGSTAESFWISIADNGCGIEPDDLGKIFDPFFTTKEPGQGTGLGLSICHRIVEELGGEIQADSQLRQGSCFKVHVPLDHSD